MAAGGSTRRGNSSWAVPQELPRRKGTPDSVLRLVEWGLMGVVLVLVTVMVGLPAWTQAAAPSPTLNLSPASGLAGVVVTVSGSNFGHTTVQLTWDGSASGMPSVTAGGNGSFSTTFKVPASSNGTHEVRAASLVVTTATSQTSKGNGSGNKKPPTTAAASAVFLFGAVAATPAPTAAPTVAPTATPGPTATASTAPAPTATVAPSSAPLPSPSPTTAPVASCSGLQALVDAASVGTTVNVPACLYREQVRITKALTLQAQAGAEIRGSDVWSSWTASGAAWKSAQTLPTFAAHGLCVGGTSRCLWPEQVFIDGAPQYQIAPLLVPLPGQFSLDASRHVVVGSDPSGHSVEVTVRDHWVRIQASDVTVSGFRMRHAASDAQDGGILVGGATGTVDRVTIQNNVLAFAHGAVVWVSGGDGHRILGNDLSGGGQLGVGLSGFGVGRTIAYDNLVRGNAIHDNNTEAFSSGWEAGGLKASSQVRMTLDNNTVFANSGPGLWCDVQCKDAVFSNNRVHHNANMGIFYEVSYGAKIFGNSVWENSWGYMGWGGGGIAIASSGGAEIYNNVVAWNADGISLVSQQRTDANPTSNIYVHDNVVVLAPQAGDATEKLMIAWLQDWNGTITSSTSGNHGALNKYWTSQADPSWCRFSWNGCIDSLATYNGTLGEEGGRYLSNLERDAALSAAGIPSAPESH